MICGALCGQEVGGFVIEVRGNGEGGYGGWGGFTAEADRTQRGGGGSAESRRSNAECRAEEGAGVIRAGGGREIHHRDTGEAEKRRGGAGGEEAVGM